MTWRPPTDERLQDQLRRLERCRRLSRLYDAKQLPFKSYYQPQEHCTDCGRAPFFVDEVVIELADGDVRRVPAHYVPVELIDMDDDHLLCHQCFVDQYYVGKYRRGITRGFGTQRPATPSSDTQYHGGYFYAGEW